jgi:hypothetical protein
MVRGLSTEVGTWVRGLHDCDTAPNQHGLGGTVRRVVPTHVVPVGTPRTSTVLGCPHMGTGNLAPFNRVRPRNYFRFVSAFSELR